MRPSLFGQVSSSIGVFFLISVSFLSFIALNEKGDSTIDFNYCIFLLVFWFLMLFFGVIGRSNTDFLIKAFIANSVVVVLLVATLFKVKSSSLLFADVYIKVLCFFALSSLLTTALFSFGLPVDALTYYELDLGYPNPSKVLFPFSILYHDMNTNGLNVLRFQSIYREAGIAQAFYLWAIALVIFMGYSRYLVVILLGGVICSFSTAGIVTAIIIIPLAYSLKRASFAVRNSRVFTQFFTKYLLVASMLLPFSMYVLVYMPYFGVMQKLESHEASITDRLPGLSELTFLGTGMYSSSSENAAINLLKGVETYGVFITVLYVLMFTVFCWFGRNKENGLKIFVCLLPIFTTSVFSQPIVDAPLVYFIVYVTRSVFSGK